LLNCYEGAANFVYQWEICDYHFALSCVKN
jgi:hypothetical protein